MSTEHKTLDTVKVDISADNALAVMDRVNERQEPWSLVATERTSTNLDFELDIEGSTGMIAISLQSDGTWTATTHVVVGEKL